MRLRALCLLFVLFLPSSIMGQDHDTHQWRLIVKSLSGNNYYIDQDSLIRTDYNTARAWYKIVPVKEGSLFDRLRNIRFFGVIMADTNYYKLYCEIDCMRKYIKTLITTAYSKEGKIIRREETLDSKWTKIPDQSSFDMIRDIVCGLK